MIARMVLCAAAAAIIALPAEAARKGSGSSGGGPPVIDLQKRCKSSAATISDMMADKSQQSSAFDTCMKSEQEARDALKKAWPEMPSAYKSFCIRPADYSPSYVEWIACVEMMIDAKKLRERADAPRTKM